MSAYGTLTALTGGKATLPPNSSARFYFIINQDTAPLLLQFMIGQTQIGQIALSAAPATGAPGGYLDSINFPLFMQATSVILTSTIPAAQIGCGYSILAPA